MESIFIRSDVAGDLGAAEGTLWGHVAQILTGLSAEDLQQFGGYRIYDPDLQQPLYEPTLTA